VARLLIVEACGELITVPKVVFSITITITLWIVDDLPTIAPHGDAEVMPLVVGVVLALGAELRCELADGLVVGAAQAWPAPAASATLNAPTIPTNRPRTADFGTFIVTPELCNRTAR
jgi:hypothetical protein